MGKYKKWIGTIDSRRQKTEDRKIKMKKAKSEGGYQNEYVNLSFLLFLAITVLSFTLPKKWTVIVLCIGGSLAFVLLILSYIYDPKRMARNAMKKRKRGDVH